MDNIVQIHIIYRNIEFENTPNEKKKQVNIVDNVK